MVRSGSIDLKARMAARITLAVALCVSGGTRAETPGECGRTLRSPCPPALAGPAAGEQEFTPRGARRGPLATGRAEPHGPPRGPADGELSGNRVGTVILSALDAHGYRYPWQAGTDARTRVLSLFRTGTGSVSLATGRGREASVQWSMPLGTGATHEALLDPWLGRTR